MQSNGPLPLTGNNEGFLDSLHAGFCLRRGLELASSRPLISTSRRIWRWRNQESVRDCRRELLAEWAKNPDSSD